MRSIFGDIRVQRSIQSIMLMLVLLATLMAGSVPAAKAQSPDLFNDAGPAMAADANGPALRSRLVSVNLGMLLDRDGKAIAASAIPEVTLNLFPDATYTGRVSKLTNYDSETYAWSGTLEGVSGGYFYLVISGGAFVAHVASTQGIYEVSTAGDDLYRVVQIDQSKFVDEPAGGPLLADNGAQPAAADASVAADTAARIDVMILYTPAARATEGGTAAMKARIALAITETNTSYANAGITARLRLVHTQEVSYTETGSFSTDLGRLKGASDGYMDNVHSLRNKFGADMVQLVENTGDACGIGYLMTTVSTTFAPYAFTVVERTCMTGYYSSGHEFGHNQGAHHDAYATGSSTGAYSYAHGFVHIGPDNPSSWRTVMAYADACVNAGVGNCTRLQYWSNPAKYHSGFAMGDTISKNFLVLNNTDLTVANFRHQVIASNFNSNFNGSATGWVPVTGPWVLSGGAYYASTGLSNTGSAATHTGKFGDSTFTVRMLRTGVCTGCANRIILRGNPALRDPTNWWRPSYVFQYTNTGVFSVYYTNSSGTSTALKSWTSTSRIVKNGWNTLKVVAVGSSLRFYINGGLVWSGTHGALAVGQVGFGYFRYTEAGTLFVDYATLTNSPTADPFPAGDVLPGVTIGGGDINHAP